MKHLLIEYRRSDGEFAVDAHKVTTEEANRIKAFLELRELSSKFLVVVPENDQQNFIYNPAQISVVLIKSIETDETPISQSKGQKPTKASRKKGT